MLVLYASYTLQPLAWFDRKMAWNEVHVLWLQPIALKTISRASTIWTKPAIIDVTSHHGISNRAGYALYTFVFFLFHASITCRMYIIIIISFALAWESNPLANIWRNPCRNVSLGRTFDIKKNAKYRKISPPPPCSFRSIRRSILYDSLVSP